MTELDKTKSEAINALSRLCQHCKERAEHSCPVQEIASRIERINGIPVIVNDRLRHVVFN